MLNTRRSFVILITTLCIVLALPSAAYGQLRVVNYNVAQLLGDHDALKEVFTALHADDKPGFAVPVSVFIFQEVRQADMAVLQQMLNDTAPPGVFYAPGTFNGQNQDAFAGAQALFRRADMLFEVTGEYTTFFTGAGRWTDRWRLRILGYDSASPLVRFYVYSSHLKAGNSSDDADLRLWGVQQIRNNSNALGGGQYIIYAGDYNFYHNTEPGYLWWFTPGAGQAFDPLGTSSWAGAPNAIKHTQSPRKIMAGGLVGGGMDDRFDFQLTSAKFIDGNGMSRIPGTYRSFGNDGLKYNEAINFGNNSYYSWDIPRSNALADALHDASDHIPVVMDYQLPARLSNFISPTNFGTVILGAQIPIQFSVTNAVNPAHVVTPIGADILQFSATGSGAISGMQSGFVEAFSPPATGSLTLTASTLGPVSGTVTFTSTSEAVQFMSPAVRTTNGTAIAPSQPSFSSSRDVPELTIELELEPDTGTHEFDVLVHNFEFVSGSQARLDIDAIDGLPSRNPLSFVDGLSSNIGATPATLTFAFNTNTASLGIHAYPLTIHTSDENLPGATSSELDLTIIIGLGEPVACLADIAGSRGNDPDGVVNGFDLLALLSAWGPCSDLDNCPADIAGAGDDGPDGVVNGFDLLSLLSQWGPCPG